MTPKHYTIKPLEWKGGKDRYGGDAVSADTVFGVFGVYKIPNDKFWRWEYCFQEVYFESEDPCDSLEHGKRLAEEYWQERITQALVEVGE